MARRANGEGSKPRKRPDGLYEARATLNTPGGRKRVSFYGKTAKEAAEKRTAAIADRNRGALFTDPGRLTVGEYLSRWLSDTARYQVADSTYDTYRRVTENHLIPFFGTVRLRDLSPAHVRAFKAEKIRTGVHANTVGMMQARLRTALEQAVDDGLIPANPAARVKKASERGEKPMRSLSEEEASRLLAAARGTRDEALVTLALRTGMRQGELAALRWEDVDLSGPATITVSRSADTRTRTRVSTTKTGKGRTIGIGPRTVEVLEHHRHQQRHERIRASSWEDPGLVFPNTRGKIRRRDSVVASLKRLLATAGLAEDIRFHDLRHTAGTLAIKRGLPIPAVAKMLGHANPAMTLRVYAHVLEDMRDEVGRAMDDLR